MAHDVVGEISDTKICIRSIHQYERDIHTLNRSAGLRICLIWHALPAQLTISTHEIAKDCIYWMGPKAKLKGPPVVHAQQMQPQHQEITEVWADKMDMVGKVPYPWPQCGVARRTKSSDVRRKIRSETQDVLVLGEEGSTHGVQGINQQRRARVVTNMSMRRRSWVANVSSGGAARYVLERPSLLLQQKRHERWAKSQLSKIPECEIGGCQKFPLDSAHFR